MYNLHSQRLRSKSHNYKITNTNYEKYWFLIFISYSRIFQNKKLWKQYLLTIIASLETMHTISNSLV
ncbi:unnamed protein product, partial [Vitis vinifera]|uniref:Uncharacterized protein n=1 Tax=Vitis vinifera TaxID=29760 RepID=E0CU87_VITVI